MPDSGKGFGDGSVPSEARLQKGARSEGAGTQVCESASTSASGTSKEQHAHPLTLVASTVQSLDDELLAVGVFALSKKARLAIAEELWRAEIRAGDVERLFRWISAGESEGKARRYLAGLLQDIEGTKEALADLDKRDRIRGGAQQRNSMNYRDAPQEGESREAWEHDRMCRIAWCRVQADGRSVAEVADELGVKEGTVTAMLDRGRVLQGGHEVRKVDRSKVEGSEERIARFRRDMQARRAQA